MQRHTHSEDKLVPAYQPNEPRFDNIIPVDIIKIIAAYLHYESSDIEFSKYSITTLKICLTFFEESLQSAQLVAGYHNFLVLNDSLFIWGSDEAYRLKQAQGATLVDEETHSSLVRMADAPANIKQISSRKKHCLALTHTGELHGWGSNLAGQLGLGARLAYQQEFKSFTPITTAPADITQVAAGDYHSVVVTNAGAIHATGSNAQYQLGFSKPTGITFQFTQITDAPANVTQVAASDKSTLLLTKNSNLYIVGALKGTLKTENGFSPITSSDQKISQIALGNSSAAVLTQQGTINTMVYNLEQGKRRNHEDPVGTLVAEASPDTSKSITQLSIGHSYSCFLTSSGGMFSYGSNSHGQLGLGDETHRSLYTPIPNPPPGISKISLGTAHTLALTKSGGLYGCGYNTGSTLGLADEEDRNTLTEIPVPWAPYIPFLTISQSSAPNETKDALIDRLTKFHMSGDPWQKLTNYVEYCEFKESLDSKVIVAPAVPITNCLMKCEKSKPHTLEQRTLLAVAYAHAHRADDPTSSLQRHVNFLLRPQQNLKTLPPNLQKACLKLFLRTNLNLQPPATICSTVSLLSFFRSHKELDFNLWLRVCLEALYPNTFINKLFTQSSSIMASAVSTLMGFITGDSPLSRIAAEVQQELAKKSNFKLPAADQAVLNHHKTHIQKQYPQLAAELFPQSNPASMALVEQESTCVLQ